ncbi:MAG: S41 family peptidase [Eubacteriales bacterium]|jgi:carboxyl-terminal processing protease|nr:S41 family peptidase [Eubacteriales bacterium]MDD3863118.1 S41 family peptidase [Eubacteriales bacterium]MDD4445389.1 S41 family peptidase [Eubacteriales bacterium]
MRRSLLIFLVIVALLAGASAMAFYTGADWEHFINPSSRGDRSISDEEYQNYRYFIDTYGKVEALRTYIDEYYYKPVTTDELELGMLRGLFMGLEDPYSYYMTAEEYESVIISLTGEYSGVGITLSPNENGFIEVIAPTEDTPAYEAGIKRGDVILAVDGIQYTGSEIDVAAAAIRGPAGTRVTLIILRDGQEIEFTMRREKILSKTVRWEWLEDQIGYIRILSFEESTATDFKEALQTLERGNAAGFILDLRDNPGGLVDVCIDVADLLMDQGTVVYSQDKDENREYFYVKDGKTELPFVVLVNEGSASSAEILSAGIQDNEVAPIVGTRTYGKGVIQQLDQLMDGSAVNLTILQYFSAKGNVIHGVGILPDEVVEAAPEDYGDDGALLIDRQLDRALEILKQR